MSVKPLTEHHLELLSLKAGYTGSSGSTFAKMPHCHGSFILANSKRPDEMSHFVAFYLGLHYLPEYPFRGFQYTKA